MKQVESLAAASTYTNLFPLFRGISVEFKFTVSRTVSTSLTTAVWSTVPLNGVSRTLDRLFVPLRMLVFVRTNFFYRRTAMVTC